MPRKEKKGSGGERKKEKKGSGGERKKGRNHRKQAAKSGPLSKFIRNKISFEQYWKLIKK
jgi:hypothetical protein